MDEILLKTFIALTESQSFTLTAQQLYLTQPAVSKRIQKLEEELQISLFHRMGHQLLLTEQGHYFLPKARLLLQQIEEIKKEINQQDQEVSGRLNIATSHHIGLHRLAPVLKEFTQNYPKVILNIEFVDSEKGQEGILNGQYELAITTLPDKIIPPLSGQVIWHDPLVFVAANTHAIRKENQVTLAMLSQIPCILPAKNTFTSKIIHQLFRDNNTSLQQIMSTNYLESLSMLAQIGIGWTILPKTMLNEQLHVIQIFEE